MARRIYVDLDNTIIDSISTVPRYIELVGHYGITESEWLTANRECLRRFNQFSHQHQYVLLQEIRPNLPERVIEEMDDILHGSRFFFHDSLQFLSSYKPEELVLLTQGNVELQTPKIEAHELEPMFGRIELLAGAAKSTGVDTDDDPIFFLDDSPPVIHEMRTSLPQVICIRVRKPAPWEPDPETSGFTPAQFICSDLSEAREVIESWRG